ncbi:MAG: helix-turn-helix domain-containing protein [Candidatus Angelobacter sp.]|nr:helix-turn-helix transcriptional regulator [Candidatus Limnocylindrales bacterium]
MDSRSPFGARLRAIRTERHLSQEQLGKMIKVNRNFVGEVERGKQNVCLDNILQLARALKVSPRDFFDLYKK